MQRKQIITEAVLTELYGLAGYYARFLDQHQIDAGQPPVFGDPEAEKQGKMLICFPAEG